MSVYLSLKNQYIIAVYTRGAGIMDASCKALLSGHPELQFSRDTGKITCSLSGHEMPCRVEVLKAYVSGKKFTKLKAEHDFDFGRLEPFLIPSKKRKYQLFCALTNRYVNRKPHEVKSHVNGRRYKQAMKKYTGGEIVLFKERLKKVSQMVQDGEDDEEGEKEESESSNLSGWLVSVEKELVPLRMEPDEGGPQAPHSDEEDSEGDQVKNDEEDRKDVRWTKQEEGSSVEKGKKRKRISHAVGPIKRKKYGSSESKSSR